jgi:hypothetical protein
MNLLSLIIQRLNQKANTTNLFQALYGLSTLNKEKGWSHYVGEGQAELVTGYDGNNGTVFWAKRGTVSISKTDQFNSVSCQEMYLTVYPLTAYLIVRKSSLPCDSSEAADYVAQIFHKALSGYDKDFKAAIKVAQYEVIPTAYNDSVPSLPLSYEWVTLTVDFNIQIVSTSEGCFDDCENITFIDTQIYVNGELFTTVPYGSSEDIIVNYLTAGQVPTTFVNGIVIVPDPEGGGSGNAVLRDEDGNLISTTPVPADSNTPIVAPNGEVFANGDLVDEVLSNGSIDIPVRYQTQGVVPTTIVANEIVVPDVPACEDATVTFEGDFLSSILSGGTYDVDCATLIDAVNVFDGGGVSGLYVKTGATVNSRSVYQKDVNHRLEYDGAKWVLIKPGSDYNAANGNQQFPWLADWSATPAVLTQSTIGSKCGSENLCEILSEVDTDNVVAEVYDCLSVDAQNELIDAISPKILITTVTFGSGVTLSFLITIDADSAGTYTAAAFSGGMASATYEKNGVGATLPITLIATDTLRIIPNASGVIKLTGTYP